jgi:hypothetical protein
LRCSKRNKLLKFDVTASCYELFRDACMPMNGRRVKWSAPFIGRVLVVDKGLRAWRRHSRTFKSRLVEQQEQGT